MDPKKFMDNPLGELKPIEFKGTKDWSFIPAPLPKEWEIPIEIWPLLAKAREELARLDGIGKHMQNYEILLTPLQKREAIRSSSLEGTYATPQQLAIFDLEPREPKSERDPSNAPKEVSNYSRAIKLGQELIQSLPFSLRFIRTLHEELLSGVRGQHRAPGNFRKSQVHIGSDRRFIPPPPDEAYRCLCELEEYINKDFSIDPLVFCFMVHYQFEAIHPFLDGNGRVGRVLLSLMIFSFLGLSRPWLYLSAFFERYKDEYISNLFNVSCKSDWDSWIAFCLRATIEQSQDSIERLEKLLRLQEEYKQKLLSHGGPVVLNDIVDNLFKSPAISIPFVADKYGVSKQTARNYIIRLEDVGILVDLKVSRRPKLYVAPSIILVAYEDLTDEMES